MRGFNLVFLHALFLGCRSSFMSKQDSASDEEASTSFIALNYLSDSEDAYMGDIERVPLERLLSGVKYLPKFPTKRIVELMNSAISLDQPAILSRLLVRYSDSLPLGHPKIQQLYHRVWSAKSESMNPMIKRFLDHGFCDRHELLDGVIDMLYDDSITPPIVLSNERLLLLMHSCYWDHSLLLRLAQANASLVPPIILERLDYFLANREQYHPAWSFTDVGSKVGARVPTVTSHFDSEFIVRTRYSTPPLGILVSGLWITHDESGVLIVDQHVDAERRSDLLSRPPNEFINLMKKESYGRYQVDGSNYFHVLSSGDIGVLILLLESSGSRIHHPRAICDSIWSQEDCHNYLIGLGELPNGALVVLMGKRSALAQWDGKAWLTDELQMSDARNFDVTTRKFFMSYRRPNSENEELNLTCTMSWIKKDLSYSF